MAIKIIKEKDEEYPIVEIDIRQYTEEKKELLDAITNGTLEGYFNCRLYDGNILRQETGTFYAGGRAGEYRLWIQDKGALVEDIEASAKITLRKIEEDALNEERKMIRCYIYSDDADEHIAIVRRDGVRVYDAQNHLNIWNDILVKNEEPIKILHAETYFDPKNILTEDYERHFTIDMPFEAYAHEHGYEIKAAKFMEEDIYESIVERLGVRHDLREYVWLEDGYWVDKNNNKWSEEIGKEKAELYSAGMFQSTDCINCIRCVGCHGCIECTDCIDCIDCTMTNNSRRCAQVKDSENCENIVKEKNVHNVYGEKGSKEKSSKPPEIEPKDIPAAPDQPKPKEPEKDM